MIRLLFRKWNRSCDDALQKGGEVYYKGSNPSDGKSNFYPPTILVNVEEDMLCMKDEIFGPLAPISTFKTDRGSD